MSSLCRLLLLVSVVALCVASSGSVSPLASLVPTLRQSLQEIADAEAKKYGCAFAIALRGANGVAVEASSGAGKAGAKAMFAWGSVTKLVTGVSIIRLANEGVLSLDETVAPILDPYWVKHGDANVTMVGMFGEAAKRVTIRHLATMMAGVPDFDTAKPNETDFARSTDPFRATCYAQPGKDWSPYDLLSLPWVSNGTMVFEPGTQKAYSSTNFMLLGFVLAAKANGGAGVPWDHLNQLAFRPPHETALLNHSLFARHGAPSPTFVSLDAFDRTSYNGHNASARPGTDVSAVHGVFGGWSASDIVAPVADIAQLAFDIFGPQSASSLVSAENISMMVNASQEWYGFATFLLSAFTGMPTDAPTGVDYGTCWGHLGATYGAFGACLSRAVCCCYCVLCPVTLCVRTVSISPRSPLCVLTLLHRVELGGAVHAGNQDHDSRGDERRDERTGRAKRRVLHRVQQSSAARRARARTARGRNERGGVEANRGL